MEDRDIIQLYWDRDEGAIPATADKYGGYCAAIARNILDDGRDAEECVNDTWLAAWNAMPPHRPARLSTFLGKLTRNLSRSFGRHAPFPRTMICLQVFDERGLIRLERRGEQLAIHLHQVGGKVDLEESGILRRLHQLMDDSDL